MSEERPPIGARVTMTEHAIKQGLQGRLNRRTGTVKSCSKELPLIIVQRDGSDYRDRYHPKFWRAL
jgi:hypothetical protein